jgi:hypothetical protein
MTPHEFCNWFQGVLDMAETDEEEGAQFTEEQLAKIRERLDAALAPNKGKRPPEHMTHLHDDPHARC